MKKTLITLCVMITSIALSFVFLSPKKLVASQAPGPVALSIVSNVPALVAEDAKVADIPGRTTLKQLTFNLVNKSNKNVYFVEIQTGNDKGRYSGIGMYMQGNRKLDAGQSLAIKQSEEIPDLTKVQIVSVIFRDGTWQGLERIARRVLINDAAFNAVGTKYGPLLASLKTKSNQTVEIAKIKKEIGDDLLPLKDIDNEDTAKFGDEVGRDAQITRHHRRAALLDALAQLDLIERASLMGADTRSLIDRAIQTVTRFNR